MTKTSDLIGKTIHNITLCDGMYYRIYFSSGGHVDVSIDEIFDADGKYVQDADDIPCEWTKHID